VQQVLVKQKLQDVWRKLQVRRLQKLKKQNIQKLVTLDVTLNLWCVTLSKRVLKSLKKNDLKGFEKKLKVEQMIASVNYLHRDDLKKQRLIIHLTYIKIRGNNKNLWKMS